MRTVQECNDRNIASKNNFFLSAGMSTNGNVKKKKWKKETTERGAGQLGKQVISVSANY